jgi:hypothetical protein
MVNFPRCYSLRLDRESPLNANLYSAHCESPCSDRRTSSHRSVSFSLTTVNANSRSSPLSSSSDRLGHSFPIRPVYCSRTPSALRESSTFLRAGINDRYCPDVQHPSYSALLDDARCSADPAHAYDSFIHSPPTTGTLFPLAARTYRTSVTESSTILRPPCVHRRSSPTAHAQSPSARLRPNRQRRLDCICCLLCRLPLLAIACGDA